VDNLNSERKPLEECRNVKKLLVIGIILVVFGALFLLLTGGLISMEEYDCRGGISPVPNQGCGDLAFWTAGGIGASIRVDIVAIALGFGLIMLRGPLPSRLAGRKPQMSTPPPSHQNRVRRAAIALILVVVVAFGGSYFYDQALGPICTQSGSIRIASAQLSSSSGDSGYYLFSLCNGTSKTINWVGASVNSQLFSSSGPHWVNTANGTSLKGLSFDSVNLGQLLPNQQVCSFTFAGWAFDAGMAGAPGMVLSAASDNSTKTNGIVDVAYNDTGVYFQLSNVNFENFTSLGARNIGYVPGTFKDKWTFLAIVLDNGATSAYVNGTEAWVGRDTGCMTLKYYAIGGQQFNPFNGVIENVSFYSTGLNPNEIGQLYAGQRVGAGLAGYWSMNDGHGCVVQDSSGNSRNGLIEGCMSLAPASTYSPNYEIAYQPLPMPSSISLTLGERANLTVAVVFSDGTVSQVSSSVVVQQS
jgi:hypothetical protein